MQVKISRKNSSGAQNVVTKATTKHLEIHKIETFCEIDDDEEVASFGNHSKEESPESR